jgi:hypothetical protein
MIDNAAGRKSEPCCTIRAETISREQSIFLAEFCQSKFANPANLNTNRCDLFFPFFFNFFFLFFAIHSLPDSESVGKRYGCFKGSAPRYVLVAAELKSMVRKRGYGGSGLWTGLMLVCGDQGRVCDGSRTG